jgi:7-carboxy-7-deazaguanine synthase
LPIALNLRIAAYILIHMNLRITEIFLSLQGEGRDVGLPTVFVRLTGCPLRCRYCDTAYAFHGGETMTSDEIMQRVGQYGIRHVTVTGGEPLAQKGCQTLLTQLCDAGYQVSVETSGAIAVDEVDRRVSKVMDFKTPGSGEAARNRLANVEHLGASDQVKFVICDRADYEWSKQLVAEHRLSERCEILFSPSAQQLPARELADWIVADRLPVRFQIQLHKYLWGDEPGR